MYRRVWNFSPGPGALPLPVLEQIRDEIVELPGAGASVLEVSHRSDAFERVIAEAEANLRELLSIPDTHRVLFLQGGASLQFAMVPMNLMRSAADYVVTGSWANKALAEAAKQGEARVVWDGADGGYPSVPGSLDGLSTGADYLHVTSNETIEGVDTIRLLTEDTSLSTGSMVVGAKWNVTGTWILAGHAQLPVTDRGLRSGVVTLIGLDYAFGQ